MGINFRIDNEDIYYLVGWIYHKHFHIYTNKTVSEVIPMILNSIQKVYREIVEEKIEMIPPPQPKSPLMYRDCNWWFGIHEFPDGTTLPFSEFEKTNLLYFTLLDFLYTISHFKGSSVLEIN